MPKKLDLTGQKFGRLTVVEYHSTKNKRAMWLCRCECGNERIHSTSNLKAGDTLSCGCYRTENIQRIRTTHGMFGTRIYSIWSDMKRRCTDSSVVGYENYGGRGIKVCEEWTNFESFYSWAIDNGYSDNLTLERIDVNGNYEPNNCKWATMIEQANNKRNNVIVEIDGVSKTVAEWSRLTGIPYMKIYKRVRRGWQGRKILDN